MIDTKFARAFKILKQKEYSNRPELFLHKNKLEKTHTIGGLYRLYNPAIDWDFVEKVIAACGNDIKRASEMLHADNDTRLSVFNLFKESYWNNLRLDEVHSEIICTHVFLSSVHIGSRKAAKILQRVIGVVDDGDIGNISIRAINNFNDAKFADLFKQRMEIYYDKVIEKNPKLAYARTGFSKRLEFEMMV